MQGLRVPRLRLARVHARLQDTLDDTRRGVLLQLTGTRDGRVGYPLVQGVEVDVLGTKLVAG